MSTTTKKRHADMPVKHTKPYPKADPVDQYGHTYSGLLKVQVDDLQSWKTKLSDACYAALLNWCRNNNAPRAPHLQHSVPRGSALQNFIVNWNPSQR